MLINSRLHAMSAFVRPVAHRGLHDAAHRIVENSLAAFEAAAAAGFAIECDVRPAADGTPIVFHDATLDRLVGRPDRLADLAPTEIAELRLTGTDVGIPTLVKALDVVAGRVPMLVEIKSEWDPPDAGFIDAIVAAAARAAGPVALMSFDPGVLVAIRARGGPLPLGIISGRYEPPGWWSDRLDAAQRRRLTDLEDTAGVAWDFVAYAVDHLPHPAVTAARAGGLPVFAWTVRTAAQLERAQLHADASIFELPVRP